MMLDKIIDIIRQLRTIAVRTMLVFKPKLSLPEIAVVFAPHPDDEVFGCCGLMKKMILAGKQVELIIMTGGGKSHSGCCDIQEDVIIAERRRLALKAASVYGVKEKCIHFLDYPDGGVQFSNGNTVALLQILSEIGKRAGNRQVTVFYPHTAGEKWNDHLYTSDIVRRLCVLVFSDARCYEYCVWFWFYNCWKIDWKNAYILKMTDVEYEAKCRAIDVYIEPKAPCGRPWSGVLPPVFLWANKWSRELYFLVK